MQADQIRIVRSTFEQIAPNADAFATRFYSDLFELDPALRALFKNDMAQQRKMLMAMLAAGVNGLDRLDTIVPTLHALGARHAAYGVTAGHYDSVAQALLLSLAEQLGASFTREVGNAWVAVYKLLSGAMQAGAAMADSPAFMSS